MLTDLEAVENKLYQPEALDAFLQKHSVHDLIKLLNKANKKETRQRIKYCFSKINHSHRYKDLLYSCLSPQPEHKQEFIKYVSSEHSEEYFKLLQQKPEEVLHIIQHNPEMIPILTQLIGYEHGIKLIKLFTELYKKQADKEECLFANDIRKGLAKGLGFEEGSNKIQEDVDTVAQMRYLEVVVNIAIIGGKCYLFVEQLLNRALSLYKTEDILLKMAMVQVISSLGQGAETSKLLRQHSIWKLVQKDACDPDQQFYVKKFLLMLLIDMSNSGHYELSQKLVKYIHEFLTSGLKSKGEELEASIDIIAHLFRTVQGIKIVVQNINILTSYVTLSRSTQDSVKKPYYDTLINLTHHGCQTSKETKQHPKYKLAINILNCIGKPNLVGELSHNLHSNNYMVYGIQDFTKWFSTLLQLPFEEIELHLIEIFQNILNYYEVIESLLQQKDTTKYLLKPKAPNDSNKTLREKKGELIRMIIQKGNSDWQGLQLSEYSRNLQKMLEGTKHENIYALDVE